MQFLSEYGLFVAKAATAALAVLLVVAGIMALVWRKRKPSKGRLEVTHLNKHYEDMGTALALALASDRAGKALHKAERQAEKTKARGEKRAAKTGKAPPRRARVYVVDFDGDPFASRVSAMREEINAILTDARKEDQVLVRLESGGGLVHAYGLAASQLQRIRDRGIPLVVAVDKIAASGGYMMACTGNRIIASPFAVIGSVGVAVEMPNLHRFLKNKDIDFEMLHAGEYKRTLTLFGENTETGRKKLQEELEEVHQLFKDFIRSQRPSLDVERISTGEHWLGTRALELGLVDALQTSDDFLLAAKDDRDLVKLEYREPKEGMRKLASVFSNALFRNRGHELAGLATSYPRARHD